MTKLHLLTQSLTESELKKIVDKEAVSTRMKRVGYDVISDILNLGTHLSEFKTIKCGTLDDFKKNLNYKIHNLDYTPTIRELFVSEISSVEEYASTEDIEDRGYKLVFKDQVYKLPFYNINDFEIRYTNGKLKTRVLNWDNTSKHYTRRVGAFGHQTSISYEALVKIAHDVLHNEVPFDLRGLNCNIITCTGNNEKAEQLDLSQSFNPRLLEWIIDENHGGHESMCVKAFKITGKAWEISGKDTYLRELMKGASNKEIAQYLEWFCMPA